MAVGALLAPDLHAHEKSLQIIAGALDLQANDIVEFRYTSAKLCIHRRDGILQRALDSYQHEIEVINAFGDFDWS